jgi:hypothetical protein
MTVEMDAEFLQRTIQVNRTLRRQVGNRQTLAQTVLAQRERLRVADGRVKFCQEYHRNFREHAEAKEITLVRISELQRVNADLKRRYNQVTKNNLDINPLRYSEPGNLLERNQDLQNEIEKLKEDLRIALRVVPTPDLTSAHAEIAKLKAQETRCQKQKDDLENQITYLTDLAAMTDDDETTALRDLVNDFRDRLRATELERDDFNLKAIRLHQQSQAETAELQATRAELAQAHHDLYTMRAAADANPQSDQPALQHNETAYATLRQLCTQLKDELRKISTISGVNSIPRLVDMISEEDECLGAGHLSEFIGLWAIWLNGITNELASKPTVPVDLECISAKLNIKNLCTTLRRVLIEAGKGSQDGEVTVDHIEGLIKEIPSIIQHEESLRRRIEQLEAKIAHLQNTSPVKVSNLEYETAIRSLNDQARTAVLLIGQQNEPRPDYGASNYIHDATDHILILQTMLASLQGEEQADNVQETFEALPQTDDQRVEEFRTYNALVNSYQELYYIIAEDHVNEEQPTGIGGIEPALTERDFANPSAFVTLLDINLLRPRIEALIAFIRTRNLPGSQPNWTAFEADFETARALSEAIERASNSVVHAKDFLDRQAYEEDTVPFEESPEADVRPESSESILSAIISALLHMKWLWQITSISPNLEAFPEGIGVPADDSELTRKDLLYKLGLNLSRLVEWVRNAERSRVGNKSFAVWSHENQRSLVL